MTHLRLPLAWSLLLFCLFFHPSAGQAARYALLIGINEYDGVSFGSLDGCRNDVILMRQVLQSPRFGFREGDVITLVDGQATHSAVMKAFGDLAARVGKGDEVYIHYSGHGSTACDLNGDERGTGLDSTLVTHGSRGGPEASGKGACPSSAEIARLRAAMDAESASLDDYDILDDQLEQALSRLAAACDTVVFVSDSCHSGTITRGEKPLKTRGVAIDTRLHPEGFLPPLPPAASRGWIGIGAAGVHEKAVEHRGDDGTPHGGFTWFWARSLLRSGPEDTWQTVFNRTRAFMRDEQIRQTPQLEGNAAKPLFGGQGTAGPVFTVMSLYPDGDKAIINAGSLTGIARGAVFRTGPEDAPTALLTVTSVNPTDCEATVDSGKAALGESLSLHSWLAPQFGLKAYLKADRPEDEVLVPAMAKVLENLPAIQPTDDPAKADMVFWLLRPEKDASGGYVRESGSFLPRADAGAGPEVWVLEPGETGFYGARERLRCTLTPDGLRDLKTNLSRLARMRAMLAMPGPAGGRAPVEFYYHLYAACSEDAFRDAPEDERLELPDGGKWKKSRVVRADGQELDLRDREQFIMVEARNSTSEIYYVYGINIMENAAISAFLPGSEHQFLTDVAPRESRFFSETGLLLTDPKEHVRLMATKRQMDVSFLEQEELRLTRSQGGTNPVETFLETQLFPRTRGVSVGTSISPSSWSTVRTTIQLGP